MFSQKKLIFSLALLATSQLAPMPCGGLDAVYAKEIHKGLDYFAAWEPTNQIALGDYGEMEGQVFKRLGNIKRFGIAIRVKRTDCGPLTFTSSGSTAVDVDVGGKDAKGENQVDIKVSFSKENSVLFKADSVTTERIENLAAVGDKLVDLYKQKGKDWKLSYVVVTELKRAGSGCVLIAKQADTQVKLSGKAAVKKDGATLANIDLRDFSVGVKKGSAFDTTWSKDCTPLFQLHEVKDPITKKAFFTEYR